MRELLPCPFCGLLPGFYTGTYRVPGRGGRPGRTCVETQIICENGECPVHVELVRDDETEAVEAWNRRAPADVVLLAQPREAK